jgi:hypothetical protein
MSKVAIADDSAPVELEGGQVIINKQASKKHWRELSKINQSAGGGLPLHEPQFKKGGIVSNDCIDFIRNSKAIINNGYYLNLSELSSIRDAYGQVPTNLKQTLITYNSGGQKNLKVTNTINAIELRKKLQSLLGIDSSQAYIVLNYYIDNARRFDTLDILDEIKHTQIAIIDRDKIVCSNMKYKNNNKISRSQKQYNKDVDAYKYFIVDLKNKKAISGWEYKQDAVDALSDYDGDTNFKVVAQVTLNKMGIENPKERFKKMSNGGNAGFDLPFGVEVNFETEGDYELEIDDFEDKLMILYQYIDFKDVYGESDSYNTNLKFYGEYELLAIIKGSYNEKRDSYDCLLIIDGESSNINFHPYNTLGGLDIGEFENQIKTSVQKLSNYSAVVSIEGYEVDGENYISEETAKVGIKNLKEKTEFNLVKGKRFGQGKRVEQDKVIEKFARGGSVVDLEKEIDALYSKSNFINTDFNWKLKLLEMLQDQSIEAYNIYQKLTKKQKDDVLQELFEVDNDMGSDGDGDIETSKENLQILLEDAKNGKKYDKGGYRDNDGEVLKWRIDENGFKPSYIIDKEKEPDYFEKYGEDKKSAWGVIYGYNIIDDKLGKYSVTWFLTDKQQLINRFPELIEYANNITGEETIGDLLAVSDTQVIFVNKLKDAKTIANDIFSKKLYALNEEDIIKKYSKVKLERLERYAKGGAITTADLNRMIEQYNSEGRSFELRGAYGNYELWSKGNRLEVGSRKDIYNALVKYRFNDKYEQGGSTDCECYHYEIGGL